MSLINQNQSFSVKDYLFVALGLSGLFLFFLTYDSHDPRSIINSSLEEQSIILKAAEIATTLGFNSGNYESEAFFSADRRLLDSLQHYLGRQEAISTLSESPVANMYPFYWEVHFNKNSSQPEEEEVTIGEGPERRSINDDFVLRLDPAGKWIGLINENDVLPDQIVDRKALRTAFKSDSNLKIWTTLPDSAWDGILTFDMERGYDLSQSPNSNNSDDNVQQSRKSEHQFTRDEVIRLAAYHIKKAGWKLDRFDLSGIRIETIESAVVARLRYLTREPVLGQNVSMQAAVTPTGLLLELDASYNSTTNGAEKLPPIIELAVVALVLLFGISCIIIFYFRIRARVIDTQSALVISILAGFIVPAVIFMNQVEDTQLFGDGANWMDFIGLAISMGVMGAISSVAFFIISAIGDSITRQHWSEKLECYDYLRQGMFFNKPVGITLVRSVVLTFIIAGLWSLLLTIFPNIYFDLEQTFLTYEAIWSPLYLVLNNFWFSLLVVFGIFLVLGSQIYAQTNNKWISGASMVLATALIAPVPLSFGPILPQFILFLFFGLALTYVFLKWDFLTLFFTHFFFIGLLVASTGWIIDNSPDLLVFVSFSTLLLFITVGGVLFIIKGKEEQALPGYVPEYVEELAQEERIKQELRIARDVQQSFLPVKTPAIASLDLAAICKPAYETGGDYYDFIQLDDHRVAVAIGDVSGKGIQAAFYMTFTKGILHTLCRETESPAELLKKANKLFYENARRGTFISLIYGIVDVSKKTFCFARAGHNPILHINGETSAMNLLQPNGLGLGLTITNSFDNNIQETTLNLIPGDQLVLYTDGIVEALNTAHQFYGTKRLRQILKNGTANSAGQILEILINDVTKFTGQAKQHDDMTVMVIKLQKELVSLQK